MEALTPTVTFLPFWGSIGAIRLRLEKLILQDAIRIVGTGRGGV